MKEVFIFICCYSILHLLNLIKSREIIAVIANCIKGETPIPNIVGIAGLYAHLPIDNALISINKAVPNPNKIINK